MFSGFLVLWCPVSYFGYGYFVAPYSGVYQLRFTSPGASLDNFYGFRKPIQSVALYEENDEANASVFEKYDGQTVNVSYDRTLSATRQGDGSWTPGAYIVSLPYDYDFTDYYEAGQARIFRLAFKEEYYKQFIFLPDGNANPNLMQAGRAYLVIVMKGQINLSATGVTLNSAVADDDRNVVNSFEDWYFEDKFTPVGKWRANLRSISDVEADTMNIYGLRDDGSWARFHSENGKEQYRMPAFRGYFEASAAAIPNEPGTRMNAPAKPRTYRTLFQNSDQQGTSSGEDVSFDNLRFEGVIPYAEEQTTGIQPTIVAIEADGTCHYFDLQGRQLNGKPDKGLFIKRPAEGCLQGKNGKKIVNR